MVAHTRRIGGPWALLVGVAVIAWCCSPAAFAFELFSSGMLTPETISPTPEGAYGGAFNNTYFIPDPGRVSADPFGSTIWAVPMSGGAPSVFVSGATTPLSVSTVGGLFLPDTPYWGSHAGKYITVGYKWDPELRRSVGEINVWEADGSYTVLYRAPGAPKTPILAPAGWGNVGGQIIVADGGPNVYAVDPLGNVTPLVPNPIIPETARFGLAFAPEGWGAVGGQLLASRSSTGQIFAVDESGVETLFAVVPLAAGQMGLRQMAFCPAGFFPGLGELLFVSVSGSAHGGGTLGDVVVLDSTGRVIARLRSTLGLEKFDPRGLYFTEAGQLLISDASDPIWLATRADFDVSMIPEPCTLVLLGIGVAGAAIRRRRAAR